MSKKTLLNETQVRRFMKLADLGATQRFHSLREGDMAYQRDDEMGGEEPAPEGDLPPAPEDEDMPPVGDEGEGQELPPEAVSAVEAAVEAAVDAMGAELEKYGVQVDASRDGEEEMPAPEDEMGGDEMGGPEMEMPMGGDDEMALQEDQQANKGHGPNTKAGKIDRTDVANKASGRWLKEGDDDEDADTLEEEGINVVDDDDIVEQVAKRVAARLMRESRSQRRERKLDAIAEKIAAKLSRK